MRKYVFVIVICLLTLVAYASFQYIHFYDGKLHIVVCDVGQGDSILIKTPSNKLLLYDGGPDDSVLSCLSDHIPFWYKSIDMFILSHPHNDHFMGMFGVFAQYKVKIYISEKLMNRSSGFQAFTNELEEQAIEARYLDKGDDIRIGDGVTLYVEGPSENFLKRTSPEGEIDESEGFASLILRIEYKSFSMLFTGDSQVAGLRDAVLKDVSVLQVPHHGSRSGLDKDILKRLDPELATISVGDNKYGHPAPEILSLLQEENVEVLRTDERGDITIVTDGDVRKVILQRK